MFRFQKRSVSSAPGLRPLRAWKSYPASRGRCAHSGSAISAPSTALRALPAGAYTFRFVPICSPVHFYRESWWSGAQIRLFIFLTTDLEVNLWFPDSQDFRHTPAVPPSNPVPLSVLQGFGIFHLKKHAGSHEPTRSAQT